MLIELCLRCFASIALDGVKQANLLDKARLASAPFFAAPLQIID
jgi:hypothetical protein